MDEPRDPVGVLLRWQGAGGSWQLLGPAGPRVTVALLRCDGGEEVDRFRSGDPELLTWLAERDAETEQGGRGG